MMMIMVQLQAEAALLKRLPGIKVVVVGIGSGVVQSELEIIASSPQDVILVPDFRSLTSIERQLLVEICGGKHVPFILRCAEQSLSVYFSSHL